MYKSIFWVIDNGGPETVSTAVNKGNGAKPLKTKEIKIYISLDLGWPA